MSDRGLAAGIGLCVVGVAGALVAASAFDAPWLGWVALALLVAAVTLREVFVWRGDGGGWLAIWGAVGGALVVAFLLSKAFG